MHIIMQWCTYALVLVEQEEDKTTTTCSVCDVSLRCAVIGDEKTMDDGTVIVPSLHFQVQCRLLLCVFAFVFVTSGNHYQYTTPRGRSLGKQKGALHVIMTTQPTT